MEGSPFQGEDEADWDKAHASAVSFSTRVMTRNPLSCEQRPRLTAAPFVHGQNAIIAFVAFANTPAVRAARDPTPRNWTGLGGQSESTKNFEVRRRIVAGEARSVQGAVGWMFQFDSIIVFSCCLTSWLPVCSKANVMRSYQNMMENTQI